MVTNAFPKDFDGKKDYLYIYNGQLKVAEGPFGLFTRIRAVFSNEYNFNMVSVAEKISNIFKDNESDTQIPRKLIENIGHLKHRYEKKHSQSDAIKCLQTVLAALNNQKKPDEEIFEEISKSPPSSVIDPDKDKKAIENHQKLFADQKKRLERQYGLENNDSIFELIEKAIDRGTFAQWTDEAAIKYWEDKALDRATDKNRKFFKETLLPKLQQAGFDVTENDLPADLASKHPRREDFNRAIIKWISKLLADHNRMNAEPGIRNFFKIVGFNKEVQFGDRLFLNSSDLREALIEEALSDMLKTYELTAEAVSRDFREKVSIPGNTLKEQGEALNREILDCLFYKHLPSIREELRKQGNGCETKDCRVVFDKAIKKMSGEDAAELVVAGEMALRPFFSAEKLKKSINEAMPESCISNTIADLKKKVDDLFTFSSETKEEKTSSDQVVVNEPVQTPKTEVSGTPEKPPVVTEEKFSSTWPYHSAKNPRGKTTKRKPVTRIVDFSDIPKTMA